MPERKVSVWNLFMYFASLGHTYSIGYAFMVIIRVWIPTIDNYECKNILRIDVIFKCPFAFDYITIYRCNAGSVQTNQFLHFIL